ncbi:MAG: YrdB family protein [Thermomicrobiales bacterium]|nr:YrdB family protein [Thermomicrobiales bacterium]
MVDTGPLNQVSPALAIALTVRFLAELALLAGAAAIAWQTAPSVWRWPAAILAPVAVAIVWGLFLSPKAAIALPPAARLVLEAAPFIGVGAGLVTIGFGAAAAIGVAIWLTDRIAIALLSR